MAVNARILSGFKFVVFDAVVLAVLGIVFMYGINPHLPWEPDASLNPDKNHIHIDWAVWVDGDRKDYSENKFMSGLSTDDSSHDEESEYLHKYLHLHDNVSHVVHRHAPGLMLVEFMNSLGFVWSPETRCLTLPAGSTHCDKDGGKKWRMIINEKEVAFDPTINFNDLDKVLTTYGASNEDIPDQWKMMTDDSCRYSQACPWRGPPPAENCIADPSIPCIADFEDDFS